MNEDSLIFHGGNYAERLNFANLDCALLTRDPDDHKFISFPLKIFLASHVVALGKLWSDEVRE